MNAHDFTLEKLRTEYKRLNIEKEKREVQHVVQGGLGRGSVTIAVFDKPLTVAAVIGYVKSEGFQAEPSGKGNTYQHIKLTPDPVGSMVEGRLAFTFRVAREKAMLDPKQYYMTNLLRAFEKALRLGSVDDVTIFVDEHEDLSDEDVVAEFYAKLKERGFEFVKRDGRMITVRPTDEAKQTALKKLMEEVGVELFTTINE